MTLIGSEKVRRNDSEIIGFKIQLSREERGLSQAELGKQIYRKRSQISKWETGKQEIPSTALFAIAEVLQVDIRFYSPDTSREPI